MAIQFLTLATFLISLSLFNVSMAHVNPRVGIAPLGDFRSLNPSDAKVVAAGKFAVDEHNKEQNKQVVFQSVVRAVGQQLGEDKYKYVLLIDGAEDDTQEQYSATVLETKYADRQLVAFNRTIGV